MDSSQCFPRMPFGIRDKLYGFHFNVEVQDYTSYVPPFSTMLRVVEVDSDNASSNDLSFETFPSSEKHGSYEVCGQVPHAMKSCTSYVVVHIVDCFHSTITHTVLSYEWIHRQRKQLREKTSEPWLSNNCKIVMKRMGRLVATAQYINVSSSLTQPTREEVTMLEFWVSLHTPPGSSVPFTLSGVEPCPIYIFLMMSDHLDSQSFDFSGRLPFTQTDVHIPKWSQDLLNTGVLVTQQFNGKQQSVDAHKIVWSLADLMMANVSCHLCRDNNTRDGFCYPQTNTVVRNSSDTIATRLCFVDMLYHAITKNDSLPFSDLRNVDFSTTDTFSKCKKMMDTHWPCLVIGRQKHGDSFHLLSGFGRRSLLNDMMIHNGTTITSPDIILFKQKEKEPTNDQVIDQAIFIIWRDYNEEVLSMCLLQKKSGIDHTKFSVQRGLGVDLFHSASGDLVYHFQDQPMFCTSIVRTVCQARLECSRVRKLNSPKVLRPILNTHQALDEMQSGDLNWHMGWVLPVRSSWEREHSTALFDVVRKSHFW